MLTKINTFSAMGTLNDGTLQQNQRELKWLNSDGEMVTERPCTDLSFGKKVQKTARWARIMTKWIITYSRRRDVKWNLVEFGGETGSESRGIVDLIAIRKDHMTNKPGLKRGDLFDIVLIQTKGGSAKSPTNYDIKRLKRVAAHHRARAVILAEWKKGKRPELYHLTSKTWQVVNPEDIFG